MSSKLHKIDSILMFHNKLFQKSVVLTSERTLKIFLKDFVIFRGPSCWTFLKLMPGGYKTRHPVIDIDLSGSWVEKGIREDIFLD